MRLDRLLFAVTLSSGVAAATAVAADRPLTAMRPAFAELAAASGGAARVVLDPATATPRLIEIPSGSLVLDGGTTKARMTSFFHRYGPVFGINDPVRELELTDTTTDGLGMTHLSYHQLYQGVPVFGAVLRGHFDRDGELVAVNGTTVPDLAIDPSPTLPPVDAAAAAIAVVAKDHGLQPTDLDNGPAKLVVLRTGLARGVPGENHLVWEIEVSALPRVREFIYVDAHSGMIVDRIAGIHQITRTVRHETFANTIWSEGDPVPYSDLTSAKNDDVNEIIAATKETYDLYSNISGGEFISFNGSDVPMHAIYEADFLTCPNASWNGRTTNYCSGFAVDDVIAHEWTHAYTDFNHNLIYQWQPGALNEAYSDIFGEMVDLLNGSGLDTPNRDRGANDCSTFFGFLVPNLTVTTPSSIAGNYDTRGANFNPAAPWTASGIVELVDDGTETTSDACQALQGFTSGRIALIDRGNCTFVDKAANAHDAGAVGVIIANNVGDTLLTMGGTRPPDLDIGSVFVGQSTGELLKSTLTETVEVSLVENAPSDESVRWLISEDRNNGGAIRDMWNPNCFGDPAKVSDSFYFCAPDSSSDNDNGGVHSNSGIPNHAFALLVDGDTYDGQRVAPIGMTKAAHIYWRAMSVYQTPYSKFPEHADALELSCSDLVGASLTRIETGGPSPQVINASDCEQVAAAMLAVEMRSDPVQCGFDPILDPGPPPAEPPYVLFAESFDTGDGVEGWTLSNEGAVPEDYTPRDWQWTGSPPIGGVGGALWAINSSFFGDNCVSDDESGVMWAETPTISIPSWASAAMLVFDHYVATEGGWDGGNLKISVNGGPFSLVEADAFQYNPYNSSLNVADEADGFTNPMAGEPAYTGLDQGELFGSWGQSQIDLGALAEPGDTIRIRFDFGVDGCTGVDGWYLDDIKVLTNDPRTLAVHRPGGRVKP